MPSLDAILGKTLLFTADAGNADLQGQPLAKPAPVFSPPAPPSAAAGAPEDQAIWAWTYDPADLAAVSGVKANVHSMGFATMPVFDRLSWGPIEIEDPSTGDPVSLPLEEVQVVRRFFLPAGRLDGTDPIWKLPANVDASLLIVFAYERDAIDPTNFVPPTEDAMAQDDFMPDPGGSPGTAPLRIVVCCELVLCKERADFEPLGILASGRVHPNVMLVSNQNLARASVTVSLVRPSTSGMTDPSMTPDIGSGLWTDTNDNSARLSLLTSGVNMILNAAGSPVPPPTPLWDNIFDYFRIDPGAGTSFTVVDPGLPIRTISGAIETLNLTTVGPVPVNFYAAQSFGKVARQGTYDNIHIAPKMLVGLAALAPDPIVMAPVCAHDCLHMHWRWGAMWSAPGLSWLPNNIALNGWDANGNPYAAPGAPQVPANQRIGITFNGPASIDYQADCLNVPGGALQYVLHHGAAYSLGFSGPPGAFFDAIIPTVNLILGFRGQPTLPLAANSWTIFQWSLFYGVLRFQPTVSGPQERIHVLDQTLAES
jgi:hypothetical protein